MLFSDTGLLGKAQEAKNTWENAENSDREAIGELVNELNEILNGIGTGSGGETNPDENEPVSLPADGSYSELKGVNTPDLADGLLTPIVWDETANGGVGEWVETESNSAWYDYTTTEKRWANAITADGSMWVWIPRYAYQISDNYHNGGAGISGTINIKFMKGTGYESADGEKTKENDWDNASGEENWNIHPAFEYNGTKAGIWVAKFEASQSDAGANAKDYQNWTGGTSGVIKIQPGVSSWRNITINEMFEKCRNYNSSLNSHLMKNSEWGAVAYLSQSSYGINEEITINNSSSFITGSAGSGVNVSKDVGTTNDYTSTQGVKASTTGTIYGIYDMSGGSWEHVASYVDNENVNLKYGSSLVSAESYMKDVYTEGSEDTSIVNYAANSNIYGDAVYETSSNGGGGNNSWYGDYLSFPCLTTPFLFRGGYYDNGSTAGIFYLQVTNGVQNGNIGFRPVLVAP